ncbi:hypothetical protein GKZ92_23185 (plasmid) [Gordonia sp. 135]|uniref:hypothetical protein n=1 Tax=Gordonia sp. 135 TaxID=2676309 RepID=UPI0012BB39A6|nr:hypothetical protein [Gordonia sp. 135]QGP90617.1 hypothetical protein GKZ92_23185 [Gordonia sp. 135]
MAIAFAIAVITVPKSSERTASNSRTEPVAAAAIPATFTPDQAAFARKYADIIDPSTCRASSDPTAKIVMLDQCNPVESISEVEPQCSSRLAKPAAISIQTWDNENSLRTDVDIDLDYRATNQVRTTLAGPGRIDNGQAYGIQLLDRDNMEGYVAIFDAPERTQLTVRWVCDPKLENWIKSSKYWIAN